MKKNHLFFFVIILKMPGYFCVPPLCRTDKSLSSATKYVFRKHSRNDSKSHAHKKYTVVFGDPHNKTNKSVPQYTLFLNILNFYYTILTRKDFTMRFQLCLQARICQLINSYQNNKHRIAKECYSGLPESKTKPQYLHFE